VTESRRTPHALSRELLEREIDEEKSADAIAAAIQRGFGRLSASLSAIVGHEGCRALLSRAAHRTRPELHGLELASGSSPDVFSNLVETLDRDGVVRTTAGAMALMTNWVDLLCTFIGEDLTSRVVGRVVAAARRGSPPGEKAEEGS